MNKKKRNSRHLYHPLHINYLTFFPIIFLLAGMIGSVALHNAQYDLRRIGMYVRGVVDPRVRQSIIYHKVRPFDTVESLAEEYNISENTILWANDSLPGGLTEDEIIMIPPITGVVHIVKNRETIEGIAALYGVRPEKILEYPYNTFSNDVAFPITPGQILIVPGGRKKLDF